MLDALKNDLLKNPCKSLIFAARYACAIWGDDRPDWAALLAGGNPDFWESVCDEARMTVEQEEEAPHDEEA